MIPIIRIKNKETGQWVETPALRGKTAYEYALEQGFEGTEEEWVESLQGESGKDGSDYVLTDADKEEIKEAVVERVPLVKVAERPTFVKSTEEMTDTSKLYVLDGYIYEYMWSESTKLPYTDLLKEADTTLISGDASATVKGGYFENVRLKSSGVLGAQSGYYATGFIPYKYTGADDLIHIKPAIFSKGSYAHELCFYDTNRTFKGYAGLSLPFASIEETIESSTANASRSEGWQFTKDDNGVFELTWKPSATNAIKNGTVNTSEIEWIRLGSSGFENVVITINEEIVGGTSEAGYKWTNTGYAYIAADYEDRIIDLENEVEETQEHLNALDNEVEEIQNRLNNEENSRELVYINPNIKAIAHRGYSTVAPENTLSAYKLAKQMGFDYVECDITQTSDGVVVLLHDDSVDRTSNGSGAITSMTYAEVKVLDFGSWKSSEYTGERIPTLEEFIKLCKNLGLHPYIEIKSTANFTSDQINSIVATVKRNGMQGKVTYISTAETRLGYVKNADPKARLGLVRANESCISELTISQALALKNDTNEVFIDVDYTKLNEESIQRAITNDFPVEAWTVPASAIPAIDPYITGYTSDDALANVVLYEANKQSTPSRIAQEL